MYRHHSDPNNDKLDKWPSWVYDLTPYLKKIGMFVLGCALAFVAVTLWGTGCNQMMTYTHVQQSAWMTVLNWSLMFASFMLAIGLGYYPATKVCKILIKWWDELV